MKDWNEFEMGAVLSLLKRTHKAKWKNTMMSAITPSKVTSPLQWLIGAWLNLCITTIFASIALIVGFIAQTLPFFQERAN